MHVNENSLVFTMVFVAVSVGIIIRYLLFTMMRMNKQQLQLIRQRDESMLKAAEKERQLIALDLHDDLGPILTAAKFKLESIAAPNESEKELQEQAVHHIQEVVTRVKQWANRLSPPAVLQSHPFNELAEFVKDFEQRSPIRFDIRPFPGLVFTGERSMHVHRMLQEIIHNAVKHSKATKFLAYATVQPENNLLVISTIDDGVGFDPVQAERMTSGTGLQNLRTRARLLHAELQIQSSPEGTRHIIKVPLKN